MTARVLASSTQISNTLKYIYPGFRAILFDPINLANVTLPHELSLFRYCSLEQRNLRLFVGGIDG